MFSKIKARTIRLYNFFFAHKKQLALFVFLLVLGLGAYAIFGSHAVLADADKGAGAAPTGGFEPGFFTSAITTMLLAGAALLIKLSIFCLSFIIEIAGYNGYLNSTAVQVGWVMVRDITNMFFVVVLLLVAFGTILGLEQYEWKKMLVKFFFAAILVNFSRVICGLIIDIGQVVMITFVNGIAATAGGNLINAFNLTDILSLSKNSDAQAITNNKEIFAAAVGAIVFAALTLGTMLIFVFILLARMLVLWVLIVLSPFAFVLSVIPQTEKYASQWWSEFGNHVIVGPVAVFFLWLSFAVVGSGQINNEISSKDNNSAPQSNMPGADIDGKPASAGITAAMSFDKIANFAIAIGILMVGAKTTQSLGTVGGSAMSKATDFAKKVATIGSGVAVGMWAYNKGKDLGSKGVSAVGKAAYNISPVSDWVTRTQNFAKRQVESWKIYRSEGPRLKMEPDYEKDAEGKYKLDAEGKKIAKLDENGKQRMQFITKKDAQGKDIADEYEFEENDTRDWFQKWRYNSRAKLIGSQKKLKKTEDQAKLQDELIDKRITAIPQGMFLRDMPDGFDRVAQGMLAAEKERSAAKTKEFQEYGRKSVLETTRFKDGEFQKASKGTMAEQITAHAERAERNQAKTKELLSSELQKYREGKGKGVVRAKVEAQFKAEVSEKGAKLAEGGAKLHFLEHSGAAALAKQAEIEAKEKLEHGEIAQLESEAQQKFAEENQEIYKDLALSELAEEAAKNFLDTIKQAQISDIFKNSEAELKAALIRLKNGESYKDVAASLTDEGAKAKLAEVQSRYFKDRIAGATRERAEDAAESLWSVERSGNEVPPTAFKNGVKKAMEPLAEVEREKSVDMATKSILKMMGKRKKGEKLDPDQEAVFMASTKHLVKNAWSDDQLHRFVQVVRNFMGGKYQEGTAEYDEAAGLKELLVDQLGWGSVEHDGKLKMSSISSEKRTNDLHRLLGFTGDTSMLLSENAVLLHQKVFNDGKDDEHQVGYSGAAEKLAAQIQAGVASGKTMDDVIQELATASMDIGRKLGWKEGRIKQQIKQFADSFTAGGSRSGQDSAAGFVSKIKEHSSAQEMLTELKSFAVDTTHLDDGGHNIHDVEEGYAHGQLSDDAMKFMLGDWVKVTATNKMSKLKSHAIADMDEDYGTLSGWDPERFAATFAGIGSRLLVEKLDERVRRHLLKNAAGESLKKDQASGAVVIGAQDSTLVKKKFGGNVEMAKVDTARDWAVALSKNAEALALVMGMNSGVDEGEAKSGKLNIEVFGKKIQDMKELVEWVNTNAKWGETVAGFEDDIRKIEKLEEKAILPGYGKRGPRSGNNRGDSTIEDE